LIGATRLLLANAPANSPIEIGYSYDLNGMIHVSAEQKGYGRRTEVLVDSRNPLGAASREVSLEGSECPDEDETRTPVNFVTHRARSILSDMPDGESKDALSSLLEKYEAALMSDSGDVDDIEDELLSMMEEF
jgi:hypothetical protein